MASVCAGWLAATAGNAALALALVAVAIAIIVTDGVSFILLAVPAVFLIPRLGPPPFDLSGSDVVLVVSAIVALPYVNARDPWLGRALGALAIFAAVLLLTVAANPSLTSVLEWVHRLFLTVGAVIVGAAIARHGRKRQALRMFVALAVVVGIVAAVHSVVSGFDTSFPFYFHKNFIGSMMVSAIILIGVAPEEFDVSSRWRFAVLTCCTAGLLASQSRGAIIALLFTLLVTAVQQGRLRRRSVRLLIGVLPAAVFAYFSIRASIGPDALPITSITHRESLLDTAFALWRASPIFGHGMRFFDTGAFELVGDPHNVVAVSLAETGIVGLAALLVLLWSVLRLTKSLQSAFGLAVFGVFVARFVHGLFDVYWVAGTQTLPWILLGLAVGDASLRQWRPESDGSVAEPRSAEPRSAEPRSAAVGPLRRPARR